MRFLSIDTTTEEDKMYCIEMSHASEKNAPRDCHSAPYKGSKTISVERVLLIQYKTVLYQQSPLYPFHYPLSTLSPRNQNYGLIFKVIFCPTLSAPKGDLGGLKTQLLR